MKATPTALTLACKRVPNEAASRRSFLRLDKNENTVGFPDALVAEMLGSFTSEMLASYPEPFLLQKRLAVFLGVDERRLILSSGSDAGIKNCFEAFVDRGDRVVRMDPTYAMVGVYCKLFGVEEVKVGYDRDLHFDFGRFLAEIRKGAKLVYLANPNSPTGTAITPEMINEICAAAAEQGAAVLVDEAYYYFCPLTAFTLLDRYDNLIIIRTFSKAGGLAAARLGYIVTHETMGDALNRWRPMYEINAFAQHCGIFMLEHWEYAESYVKEIIAVRDAFVRELRARGFRVFESHANFVLVEVSKERIPAIVEAFRRQGILIKGGGAEFPLSETLRFSIGVKTQMDRCLALLEQFL